MNVREIINAAAFGGLTGFWSYLSFFILPLGTDKFARWIAPAWGRSVLSACGVHVEVRGLDQVLDAPAYLVMANHTSHFDVPALYATMPLVMKAVAKKQLGYIPVFGWAIALGGAIMIDRSNKKKAINSVKKAGEVIRTGQTVLMFPEGTRTPPGQLGPLKKGPFHLALASQVPILPVGISGSGQVLAKGDWRVRPGTIHIVVGTPISTQGREDTDAERTKLMAEVEAALASLMDGGVRS